MLDLLIVDARICDGTGAPSFMGSLGVEDGVIRYLGKTNGQTAERVLDAEGLVLAPGFVDPHTHYDAQIAGDPLLTCSPWHGVTTVVMGNCGVGVAPVKPETREMCGTCHGKETARKDTPKVDVREHGGRFLCWECHYPHLPEGRG